MKRRALVAFTFVGMLCLLAVFFAACERAGDGLVQRPAGDAGDNDLGDDRAASLAEDISDADDDSINDDDVSDDDTVQYCESLTDEELNLFRNIFCAGASYSDPWVGQSPWPGWRLPAWYHGKILQKVWEKLGPCVDYVPKVWVVWYSDFEQVPEGVTLSWSTDAFYHYLDGNPAPEQFRQRVSGYLDTLFGENGVDEGVWFIGGNVPKLLMLTNGYQGDKDEALQIIQEEMAARPYTRLIDFDFFMEKLLAGKIRYNGIRIGFFDIIRLDFLHATFFGHQVIADIFIQELNDQWPRLEIPQWGEIEIE